MQNLLNKIKTCTTCAPHLPHGINPVFDANPTSKIIILGQAPGSKVHHTGIPWDDPSGDRLREWLNVTKHDFYNTDYFALIPMGFCYPGKGKNGDLPPRKECAPQWHAPLLKCMKKVELILLIGQYAQQYYLNDQAGKTLTITVKSYEQYLPKYLPLPHPSPRNNIWLKKNPWFDQLLLPELRKQVKGIIP